MTSPQPKNMQTAGAKDILARIRADQELWERRAIEAQAAAAQAYARLLDIAENSESGQAAGVTGFLASTYDGRAYAFDLFELRTFDVAISDDMLLCLDALRWAKADLYKLVPDGESRVLAIIAKG